jgi:hypothetical protein
VVEPFLRLSRDDQREVLEQAREETDRPTHGWDHQAIDLQHPYQRHSG